MNKEKSQILNRSSDNVVQPPVKTAAVAPRKYSIRAFGELLSYSWILNNMGFFLFLSVLAIFYIANGHMADNRIRRINETANKLKDLQYEYKTVKSDMMFRSRESELVKAAEPLGLQPDSNPPFRIKALQPQTN